MGHQKEGRPCRWKTKLKAAPSMGHQKEGSPADGAPKENAATPIEHQQRRRPRRRGTYREGGPVHAPPTREATPPMVHQKGRRPRRWGTERGSMANRERNATTQGTNTLTETHKPRKRCTPCIETPNRLMQRNVATIANNTDMPDPHPHVNARRPNLCLRERNHHHGSKLSPLELNGRTCTVGIMVVPIEGRTPRPVH